MSKRTAATLEVDGRALSVTNENKVLWPADGYTKGDLIAYYRGVAEWLLPHLLDRPLTLQRFPDGIEGQSFFEKQAPRGLPDWVQTVSVPAATGPARDIRFILCNDEATLTYVANLASIVLHVWTSRVDALDAPDFIFFDLDPNDGCTLGTLAKVALALQATLAEIGLTALVKSSGGSGLHVAVPLTADYSYEIARGFAEVVARTLHARMGKETTLERMPAKRPNGTVYLDYVQVGKGKTMVSAYSARARDGAPVSMPLTWDEVDSMARKRAKETSGEFARYTIRTAPKRLAEKGDLWGAPHWRPQRIASALKRAQRLWT